ncbi:DNA polymerase V subunit UmuC [Shimwellia blattae]|nr:hypothetical protein EB105725_21_00130 [Shimwellia blattae DSM 4481 = NBRC 105725]VDY64748.1 DNA polymerase V subunit UmuC [Shimwellia blattae]VEC22847.1 DNA polymerase V subunit UmuC [Shimwellia blattae]
MSLFPMSEVWCIGRWIAKKLEAMGIRTVLELADTDLYVIRKNFNVVLERTVRDIIAADTHCLDAIWHDGHRYQKSGVMLGDFYSQGVAQLNLFDDLAPRCNSDKLMSVIDKLNTREGKGTIYFSGQGIAQSWQMKREMLSPRCTNRLSDFLVVK